MCSAIDMALFVLNKYYRHSRAAPAYVAATLLDPTKRKRHLEYVWDGPGMDQAVNNVQAIWEVKYKNLPSSNESQQKKKTEELSVFDKILEELNVALDPATEDDFLSFIDSPPIRLCDLKPIQWWCLSEQRARYPRLHRMALDILSIPAMVDIPEWIFSPVTRTVTSWSEDEELEPEKIEMMELLSNWLTQGKSHGDDHMDESFDEFENSGEGSDEGSDDGSDESTC